MLIPLLSSAKISSIDEITKPSTRFSSVKKNTNNTTTTTIYTINHSNHIPPSVGMVNMNPPTNLDLTTLTTVITSAIANANPTKTLRIPPFIHSDIKSWLHSIITQLSYTTFFTPLLNANQSFVSIKNAGENPTVDAALYT